MKTILDCVGVTKSFGGVVALASVDLAIQEGEIVGLIGPNGSGKSTMLNVISGFYRPDAGAVWFDKVRIDRVPSHALARIGIARTFQNLALYDSLSVLDNLLIGMHTEFLSSGGFAWTWMSATLGFAGARRRESGALLEGRALLERLRLADVADRPVRALSYGQKKRLELARATLIRPQLMLLDEPTAGLSPDEATQMLHLLRELRLQSGVTMVVIEHRLEWVMDIADRIAVLDAGRKTAEGTPDEVVSDPNVIAAYLGYGP